MTMLALLAMMAAQAQPAPPPRLTFFHGEEYLASWLESSEPRRGDRVRSRILRVRHGIQPFWLVLEIDCAANTIATVSAHRAAPGDATLPSFEGDASHRPFRVWYRFERALQAAVCEGRFDHPSTPPAASVEEAMALAPALIERAVRARPLQLITVRAGSAVVMVDRATLAGGGPQWEVRSLTHTQNGRPLEWSWWEVDCDSWRRTADLRWSAPVRQGRGYGARTTDDAAARAVTPGSQEAAVLDTACASDVWARPVSGSIEEALGRSAPAHQRRPSSRQ